MDSLLWLKDYLKRDFRGILYMNELEYLPLCFSCLMPEIFYLYGKNF